MKTIKGFVTGVDTSKYKKGESIFMKYKIFICDDCEESFRAEERTDGGTHQCPHCGSLDTWSDEEEETDGNL